ncbi:MAG: anhydro-N-acetylmuramic acid kinase, partial [Hyphomicrobiales bacterium]|nr:anhydro-N-acetylmuramic acid kinase [Hyphomicrobiales bacterium]
MVGGPVIDAHALIGTIGLMSGTSLDGIDLAFLKTDGESQVQRGASMTIAYPDAQRRRLREFLDQVKATPGDLPGGMDSIERDLTLAHVEAVKAFLQRENIKRESVELLGFHGQTVLHRPECGQTLQLGDAELLARETG